MFKVEMNFTYGWDDAGWTNNGLPWRFQTRAEAQQEIDELIEDTAEAASMNYMDETYSKEDFRIVEA
jgi:hypothetical protein